MAKQSKPKFEKTTDSINDRGVVDQGVITGSPTEEPRGSRPAEADYAGDGWNRMDADTIAQHNHK